MKVYVVVITQIEWAEVDQVFANEDDARARADLLNGAIDKVQNFERPPLGSDHWEKVHEIVEAARAEVEPEIGVELASRLGHFEEAQVEEHELL